MDYLYDRLADYNQKDIYPMHMPGHKRNTTLFDMPNPYSMDITEIEDFDDLHEAEGIIKESMERAKELYKSEQTYYLVNGSSVGLLAGIMACTKKQDCVLVARNCHKAVYNAMFLHELKPVYLYPEFNEEYGCFEEVSPQAVKEALEVNKEIKLVVITSPTYEGVVSDIRAIADLCHERNIPLLVDEAHGAHLGFHPYFPQSAVTLGADVVIQSIHKTMPAFTQSALMHCNGNLVSEEKVKDYLKYLQSSSPSYLLMASIDRAITFTIENKDRCFNEFKERLEAFYNKMEQLRHIKIYHKENRDPSKIVIGVMNTDITAAELYRRLLEEHKIQLEMISKDYGLAMTSFCDTEEGYERLADALLSIDKTIHSKKQETSNSPYASIKVPAVRYAYEVIHKDYETVPISEAIDQISAEYIYFYPPGIPIVVPGEVLTEELIEGIKEYQKDGISIRGVKDSSLKTIRIMKEQGSE